MNSSNPPGTVQVTRKKVSTLKLPTAGTTPKAPQPHPLAGWIGQRVTVQRGPVTYTGKLDAITNRFLIFSGCTVRGNQQSVQVPICHVANDSIAHCHPAVDLGVPLGS